jgi:hypothetical protein
MGIGVCPELGERHEPLRPRDLGGSDGENAIDQRVPTPPIGPIGALYVGTYVGLIAIRDTY